MSNLGEKIAEMSVRILEQNEMREHIHTLENKIEELPKKESGVDMEVLISAGKLSLKQKILLLKALGILDSKEIKSLPDTKKAILLSRLLNYSEKSVKDLLTYIDKKEPPADFFIYKEDNIKKINELLESVGIEKHVSTIPK